MARFAIVSAIEEELRGLRECMSSAVRMRRADREFWVGMLDGQEVVLVQSRIGKVAAATTAAVLLTEFEVDRLLFTGVAGGLAEGVQVGDVVVADALLQHDMDASPLYPKFEVPLYGTDRFCTDVTLSTTAETTAVDMLTDALGRGVWQSFRAHVPRVHRGLIVSGDRFVSSVRECQSLRTALPAALAVEMEGAALAQVCADFAVPFAVVRTISDCADDMAHVDFSQFIAEVASRYTVAIVRRLMKGLAPR